ncbi:MAG TPA: hypothetical protein VGI45_29840 [Terracidiphilus sp.]
MQLVVPAPVNEFWLHNNALNVGKTGDPDPLSLIEVVFVIEPSVAVSVTVCEDTTAVAIAVKFKLVAPEGTVTDAGTVIEVLLLERFTGNPALGAAAVNFTVQISLSAPISVVVAQLKVDREAVDDPEPLPCSFTQPEVLDVVILLIAVMLSCPVESVVDPGSKRTCATRLWPERSVVGNELAFTVKALLELVSSSTSIAVSP